MGSGPRGCCHLCCAVHNLRSVCRESRRSPVLYRFLQRARWPFTWRAQRRLPFFLPGLIGSVTGSTVANVYTTGQFTIPMMKRLGYKPSVAGAVEALASNGGADHAPYSWGCGFHFGGLQRRALYQSRDCQLNSRVALFRRTVLVHALGSP